MQSRSQPPLPSTLLLKITFASWSTSIPPPPPQVACYRGHKVYGGFGLVGGGVGVGGVGPLYHPTPPPPSINTSLGFMQHQRFAPSIAKALNMDLILALY